MNTGRLWRIRRGGGGKSRGVESASYPGRRELEEGGTAPARGEWENNCAAAMTSVASVVSETVTFTVPLTMETVAMDLIIKTQVTKIMEELKLIVGKMEQMILVLKKPPLYLIHPHLVQVRT